MLTRTTTTDKVFTEAQILQIWQFAHDNGTSPDIYDGETWGQIQVSTRGAAGEKFAGMQIIFEAGIYEVSQYMAGPKEDQMWIYGNYPTLKGALTSLIKGNGSRRKVIEVIR